VNELESYWQIRFGPSGLYASCICEYFQFAQLHRVLSSSSSFSLSFSYKANDQLCQSIRL